jgi:chitinase
MSVRRRLAGLGVVTLLASAAGTAVVGTGSRAVAAAANPLTANWYESAPCYYTLDSTAPDLGQVMAATGEKAFELAFVLAPNGGGCTPTWDGTDPVSSDTQVAAVISEVRADGDEASYQGPNWTAKWWTQGGYPGDSSGAWADDGPCT